MKDYKKILGIITAVAILGFAGFVFAHAPGGYGRHHMGYDGHMGPGYMPHMWDGDSKGYSGYSEEQSSEINKARESFLKTTNELRSKIYQKKLEIRSDLSKKNIDVVKTRALQKELSKLEGDFDQKRLDFELKISKIAPDASRGYSGRMMMNTGPGYGGYCWR